MNYIEKIRAGEMAIESDLEHGDYTLISKTIWPYDQNCLGTYKYYFQDECAPEEWDMADDRPEMEIIKASKLLEFIKKQDPEKEEWKPKFGEKVLAWDHGESEPVEMIFLGKTDTKGHICDCFLMTTDEEFRKIDPKCEWFNSIKPLPTKTKVTLEEIAEWKGVDTDQIEIV